MLNKSSWQPCASIYIELGPTLSQLSSAVKDGDIPTLEGRDSELPLLLRPHDVMQWISDQQLNFDRSALGKFDRALQHRIDLGDSDIRAFEMACSAIRDRFAPGQWLKKRLEFDLEPSYRYSDSEISELLSLPLVYVTGRPGNLNRGITSIKPLCNSRGNDERTLGRIVLERIFRVGANNTTDLREILGVPVEFGGNSALKEDLLQELQVV